MANESRVPTSDNHKPAVSGWSLETGIDYLLAVIREKDTSIRSMVEGNDRRYSERFDAIQHALMVGLAAQKNESSLALAAADRAVQKAEAASEKRFDAVNEFRGTLADQQRTLMPRAEVSVVAGALSDKIQSMDAAMSSKITALEKQIDNLVSERQGIIGGRASAAAVLAFVLAFMAILAAVAAFWTKAVAAP